jgi:hypothetical protein
LASRNLTEILELSYDSAYAHLLLVSRCKQTDKQPHYLRTGQHMNIRAADESPLSSRRAFVVQLREQANVELGQWVGRIEHVTSGQATHFQSLEELQAFVCGF